jgi:glycosyltransferase involved in cell wall biosynthesis
MKFTVITPSLNQGEFIERTIRSVLDQGWDDLEYLILDGGSTDGTLDVIRRYEDEIDWWISEPDRGQTDAINKGLARATGDVVAYINSDDYYLPDAFERAAAALEREDAPWVVGASRFDDPVGDESSVWRPALPQGPRHLWILGPWGAPQPSSFWRRDLFERLGPFREDMHYAFDTEFVLRLVLAGEMPAIVGDELAVRYLQPEAKSADWEPFGAEVSRFPQIFAPSLTRGERARMAARRVGSRLGFFRLHGLAIDAVGKLPLTLPHRFDFGDDAQVVGDDLLRPDAWDSLRTKTSGPFSIASDRAELEHQADERPEIGARVQLLEDELTRRGAESVVSYGVGAAVPEAWMLRINPTRRLTVTDYAPETVARLRELLPEADVRHHDLLADGPLAGDIHLFHRIDTEFSNAQWREICERFSDETLILVATEVVPASEFPQRMRRAYRNRHATRAGFARNKGAFESLWRSSHASKAVDFADLTGWILEPK